MLAAGHLAVACNAAQYCICCGGGDDISTAKKIKGCLCRRQHHRGHGVADAAKDSYPSQLQNILGDTYEVGNFGVSKYAALHTAKWPVLGHG